MPEIQVKLQDNITTTSTTSELIFSCRICRVILCKESHLVTHEPGRHTFSHHRLNKERKEQNTSISSVPSLDELVSFDEEGVSVSSSSSSATRCTSLFLSEPLQWMKEAASADPVEEKLICYSCGTRVGALRWAGGQCSCGTWVCPAIVLYKKSLDTVKTTT
jgi:hypothetical protein